MLQGSGKHIDNFSFPHIPTSFPVRHDGLIIMATNRPYDLDEAMHRRIMIAIEFRQPDHILRKSIWVSHIPEAMKMDSDVDLVGCWDLSDRVHRFSSPVFRMSLPFALS